MGKAGTSTLGHPRLTLSSNRCPLTNPEPEASGQERCADGIDIINAAKISKMVLLAPDIVEAIVEGRADDRVMLKVLEGKLPVEWEEQRGMSGI
jgi:hypothetical protein